MIHIDDLVKIAASLPRANGHRHNGLDVVIPSSVDTAITLAAPAAIRKATVFSRPFVNARGNHEFRWVYDDRIDLGYGNE